MYLLLGSGSLPVGKTGALSDLWISETGSLFPRQVWLTTENDRYMWLRAQ